jgi:RNA polymerase sigma factor (TIGR02999 family)
MTDVTQILANLESGDPSAAEQLLPLVYDELRKLAAAKMAQEKPGQTLQATALVHDAYLRLVDANAAKHWDSRGHFFAAAAEAMRRILIGRARQKSSQKRGVGWQKVSLEARVYAGLSLEDAAAALGIAPRSAYREWAFAQAWLMRELQADDD